jgi:hypothetical protein
MNARGARKSAFLGMPHGTAANRLRKMVMFSLLERHGENVCFKCSEKIETAEQLSIEHKLPWEGVSVELFWSWITSPSRISSAIAITVMPAAGPKDERSAPKARPGVEDVRRFNP